MTRNDAEKFVTEITSVTTDAHATILDDGKGAVAVAWRGPESTWHVENVVPSWVRVRWSIAASKARKAAR
jgi:hypothetical protein